MMTERLYDQDSHMQRFEGKVMSCLPADDAYHVILDRTAFFPEGGGQQADTGFLGTVQVLDVKEKGGVIYHVTQEPLEPGSTVNGQINWEQRFDRMQQHTGEHIVSGLMSAKFGYHNVGFHLADEYCTLDFDGAITKEELKEVEREANQAVAANLEVRVRYPSREELKNLEYRSKIEIEGQVRIVEIPGYDICACCAPHMNRTGEIGLIKLADMANYKGGVRIHLLNGFRALRDYDAKSESVKAISANLCAKPDQVAEAVEHLKKEQSVLKNMAAACQRRLLGYRAMEVPADQKVVCVFDGKLEGNGPRELMNLILERGVTVCGVFAGTEEEGYRYVIGSQGEDVRPAAKKLNDTFAGRGGGKPEMVQGTLRGAKEGIEEKMKEIFA